MAIIKKRDLKALGKEELENRLNDLKLEKLKVNAQKGQASGKSVKSKELRRTIARIHTQLNQTKTKI